MNQRLSPQITRISKNLRSAGRWKRYQMFSRERSVGHLFTGNWRVQLPFLRKAECRKAKVPKPIGNLDNSQLVCSAGARCTLRNKVRDCEPKERETGVGGNSASGSLSIFMAAMNQHYMRLELAPQAEGVAKLPRIAAAGASKEEKE